MKNRSIDAEDLLLDGSRVARKGYADPQYAGTVDNTPFDNTPAGGAGYPEASAADDRAAAAAAKSALEAEKQAEAARADTAEAEGAALTESKGKVERALQILQALHDAAIAKGEAQEASAPAQHPLVPTAYKHTHTHTHGHTWTHTHMHKHTFTSTDILAYTHTHTNTQCMCYTCVTLHTGHTLWQLGVRGLRVAHSADRQRGGGRSVAHHTLTLWGVECTLAVIGTGGPASIASLETRCATVDAKCEATAARLRGAEAEREEVKTLLAATEAEKVAAEAEGRRLQTELEQAREEIAAKAAELAAQVAAMKEAEAAAELAARAAATERDSLIGRGAELE
eukprot:1266767-Pyramimonas_sp.AAC.2